MRLTNSQISHFFSASLSLKRLPVLVMLGVILAGATSPVVIVRADSITDQIDALNAQNSQKYDALSSLQSQAASYQDVINHLQAQINSLQAAIDANQAEQASLESQIAAAQAKLDEQKAGLAQDLKAMYVSGEMSAVEMLATSKSLSDYINAETYSSAVQNKIQATLDEIAALQAQLLQQKAQVDQLLAVQHQQEASLADARNQQQQLLSMNQSQQDSYNQQIAANNSKISQLQAEEAAAHARLSGSGQVSIVSSGSCGGGYPGVAVGSSGNWGCNYGLDDGVDSWGMYNRECVSYTAWKAYQAYGSYNGRRGMPYWGSVYANADGWPSDADAYHIPRGSTPRAGSVAIGTDPYWFGPVGHAMWVEAVSGNQILVSQMNFSGPGKYSEMWISTSLIDTYIYFGG